MHVCIFDSFRFGGSAFSFSSYSSPYPQNFSCSLLLPQLLSSATLRSPLLSFQEERRLRSLVFLRLLNWKLLASYFPLGLEPMETLLYGWLLVLGALSCLLLTSDSCEVRLSCVSPNFTLLVPSVRSYSPRSILSSNPRKLLLLSQKRSSRLCSSNFRRLLTISSSSSAGFCGWCSKVLLLSQTLTIPQEFQEMSCSLTRKGPQRRQRYSKPPTKCTNCRSSFFIASFRWAPDAMERLQWRLSTRTVKSTQRSFPVQQLATMAHLWMRGQVGKAQAYRAVKCSSQRMGAPTKMRYSADSREWRW